MAPATKDAPAEKAEKVREIPKEITWKDDKRAQYARLIVTNYVKSNAKNFGTTSDKVTVDTITDAILLKAGKELAGGNMLDGKDGLKLIQELSANGSTTGRALTESYASEVRPFIRKLILAPAFGRRGGLSEEEKAEREKKRVEEKEKRAKEVAERKAQREKEAAERKAKKDAEEKAKKEAEAKKKADAEKNPAGGRSSGRSSK